MSEKFSRRGVETAGPVYRCERCGFDDPPPPRLSVAAAERIHRAGHECADRGGSHEEAMEATVRQALLELARLWQGPHDA
jgi:hypothetical protein